MKITEVEIFEYNIPMDPFVIALGTLYEVNNILIKIHTDAGIIGYGEGSPFPFIVGETQGTCIALAKDFATIWKGKDPLAIEDRMLELNQYVPHNTTVKSTFDMALYDIAAQHAQQPLYAFLGGKKRTLQTDETIVIGTAAEMAIKAVKLKQEGAPFLKLKLGKGNNIEADLERIRAVRTAIGNEIPLRLDANQGWSVENAIRILTTLKNDNIELCEQPVLHHDYEGLKQISDAVIIPVVGDEACFNSIQAKQLIKLKACKFFNVKLSKSGGILEAMKIAKLSGEAGMECMLGGMIESKLALTANAHLACAFDHFKYFDLDLCFPHKIDPVVGGVTFENKYTLHLPDVPGLGATVEETFLNKCKKYTI